MDNSWQNEIYGQYETTLSSNNIPIELVEFPREFITRVLLSAIFTLKGVNRIQAAELYMQNQTIKLIVNAQEISLKDFPSVFITNTIQGMVESLKGVDSASNILIQVNAI
jgi:hypothetical protein